MDIQSVVDFIDLVKNPDKYKTQVSNLKAEADRVEAAISMIGPVQEITKIRKETETLYNQMVAQVLESETKLKEQNKANANDLYNKQVKLDTKEADLNAQIAVFEAQQVAASKIIENLNSRQKELIVAGEKAISKQAELDTLILDYTTRIAKLQAAMG